MCGRYYIGEKTAYEIETELGLEPDSVTLPSGDVTPATNPVVLSAGRDGDKGKLRIGTMFWGIEGPEHKLIINARSESVLEKPTFSGSFEHRRCILPAAGFYEWDLSGRDLSVIAEQRFRYNTDDKGQ